MSCYQFFVSIKGSTSNVITVSVLVSICEQDYTNSFQVIFTKLGRIMDYCCGKNQLNFGIDLTQVGLMAAILDFCYNRLHMKWIHPADLR